MSIRFPTELYEYGEFDWKGEFKITKPMPENIKKFTKIIRSF